MILTTTNKKALKFKGFLEGIEGQKL